jgi:hypothetical protein
MNIPLKTLPSALGALLLGFAVTLTPANAADVAVTVEKTSDGGFIVKADGKPFATYVVTEANKTYLWPVYGPTGKAMTRAYPMLEVEGEQHDHPHHRGICYGHESVGFPGWTETEKTGKVTGGGETWPEARTFAPKAAKPGEAPPAPHKRLPLLGSIKHIEYKQLSAKGNEAVVVDLCEHRDPSGKSFLTEERTMIFRATTTTRSIDFDQDFIASQGTVRFDDRKDAGLSIRVPTSMAVDSKQGGKIVNSEGLTDADAWSKSAKWCDYHGPVEGEHLGVAMFNHPSSFRYPTRWHVRTYGLFTANPFAAKQFNKEEQDASHDLQKGQRLKLRHRFLLHSGDEKAAGIKEAYEAYAKEVK